jgi:hypothetical protein
MTCTGAAMSPRRTSVTLISPVEPNSSAQPSVRATTEISSERIDDAKYAAHNPSPHGAC